MRIAVALAKREIQRRERLPIAQRDVDDPVQVNGSRVRRDNGDSHARIDQTDDGRELLDFSGDLYGREVRAAFVERLREERAYASVDELVVQIGRDVDQVRSLLAATSPPEG